jgi:hypothetical protein
VPPIYSDIHHLTRWRFDVPMTYGYSLAREMKAAPHKSGSSGRWFAIRPLHAEKVMGIVAMLCLLSRLPCLAQSNDVYSFFTTGSTPLTGYRIAVVSSSPIWVVGAAQKRFGIEKCQYWTDSTGHPIPWPATRVKQPGDKQHSYTRFQLGHASISIPLPPIDLALLAGAVALVLVFFPVVRFAGGRWRRDNQAIKV